MPSLLILLFVIAFAITPHVAIAQFVPTEIVYENSQEDVSATHARLEEFGDEIILAGDNRKIIRFEFEYFGKFEADGDEKCVLRFYRNDGEALILESTLHHRFCRTSKHIFHRHLLQTFQSIRIQIG